MQIQHSQNLILSILSLQQDEIKSKLELVNASQRLIPGGVVAFRDLIGLPSLKSVAKTMGVPQTQTMIFLLIANFCKSFNVVRNMTEDQMVECAVYLLDECRDFTVDDYVIMFALGKRGKLGNVMDHIDIEVIAEIHQEYLAHRQAKFKVINEERKRAERQARGQEIKKQDPEAIDNAIQALKDLTNEMVNKEKLEDERRHRAMIESRDRQVVEMMESQMMLGIAPDKYLREYYLKKIGR